MAQAGSDPFGPFSFCGQPGKGVFPMAKHRVGGKKSHVKKVGRKRTRKSHSKKSALKV